MVSNNWAGTADVIALKGFKRLARINVIPDEAQRLAEINADPDRKFFFDGIRREHRRGQQPVRGRRLRVGERSLRLLLAPELRRRGLDRPPHPGDRLAHQDRRRRADHMALSPDGRRLLVSASTARNVNVIDTRNGRIVGRIPSGDQPHEVNYSRGWQDDLPRQHRHGLHRHRRPLRIGHQGRARLRGDRRAHPAGQAQDRHGRLADFGASGLSSAVRPMAIAPGERFIYFQLSFFHGFVDDLKRDRPRVSPCCRRASGRGSCRVRSICSTRPTTA